ncbi:uncharacterized protein si:ch211-195b15.8 [Osmerus mordax]|uniref:uncharacterized protein si:ch211-195b15.8 n=1 Tax=Osmerus mordax TaxID=8014 RepID=UPI00350F59E5
MVFYKERDNERPLLSLILPHLYLGAETDVTQDCLTARGISYVISVSRCSPQPTFLPCSQYLRIPIDDSLRDDLLPWIPEALLFIDGAMSGGGSVLIHCAAGISRSPALAVAYIMYHMGMDLDHAYRFVKERRPSISPNFNFLGQLQHFQGTLSQKDTNDNSVIQPVKSVDVCLQSSKENIRCTSTVPLSANKSIHFLEKSCITKDFSEVVKVYSENSNYHPEKTEQRYSHVDEFLVPNSSGNQQQSEQRSTSQLTLSLSSKLRTLTLNQKQLEGQVPSEASTPSPNEQDKAIFKPTQQQIPSSFASLAEKRKSLTLSLSPVSANPPTHHQAAPKCINENLATTHQTALTSTSNTINKRDTGSAIGVKRRSRKSSVGVNSSVQSDENLRETSISRSKAARPNSSSSQNKMKAEREGQAQRQDQPSHPQSVEKRKPNTAQKQGRGHNKGQAENWRSSIKSQRTTIVCQQVPPEKKIVTSAVEAQEGVDSDQSILSPLSLTVNKLLGWGERMLLGVLLGPRIKVGQATLPYRC